MLPSSPRRTAPRTTAVHAYTGCITSMEPFSLLAFAFACVGRSLYGGGAALVKCAFSRRYK